MLFRGRDFRFFEKKLGKKLPCWVVARLNIYNFKNSLVGLQPGKKAFAELFSKSDNASPYKSYYDVQYKLQIQDGEKWDMQFTLS